MIRRPAAAGTFYPADPDELARTVDDLLDDATTTSGVANPKAIVVPHAGYVHSGPVAASAYALIRGAGAMRRVVLLGPAHFVPLRGFAVPEVDAWRTPLGDIAVDRELRDLAVAGGAQADDRPHEPEHALEVQLPFLIRALPAGVGVLPLAVGLAGVDETADLLAALWERTDLVVVSTDLSHYLDGETAEVVDRRTADAVQGRDPGGITLDAACGVFALRGFVELARRRNLEVRLVDLRTSAETTDEHERVVGYGAFAVPDRATMRDTGEDR